MLLSDKEWYSLMSGMILGKYVKKKGNNDVTSVVSVNKRPIRVSNNTTIGVTVGKKKLTNRDYSVVRIPIMCNGVNIGVGAMVVKLQWESYLRFTGVDFGDFGSNINIDDTRANSHRELRVIGQRESNMGLEDFVLFWVNFEVLHVPYEVDRVNINCIKTSGTSMEDTSLLTYKGGSLFYINPIEVNRGFVYFDSNNREISPPISIEVDGPNNFPIGSNDIPMGYEETSPVGGSTIGNYVLNGYLGGLGGGAWVVINVVQGGRVIGSDRVWVDTGNFSINGSMGIHTSEPGYGSISIEIVVEPEEDDDNPYYILIPAGGFSMVFDTSVSKGDETFPKRPMIVKYVDKCEILDIHDIIIYNNEPIDVDDNLDKVYIEGMYDKDIINIDITNKEYLDAIGVLDKISVELEEAPIEWDVDEVYSNIDVKDDMDIEVKEVNITNEPKLDAIGLGDVIDIE